MKIGEKIRQQRRLLDIKQGELSKLVGVSLKTIQRWENGERSPRLDEITKLAEALKVSSNYLMEQEETLSPMQETISQLEKERERDINMAVITLKDGNRVQAPATPEGYAFLERLFAMSIDEQLREFAKAGVKSEESRPAPWVTALGREAGQVATA